MHLFEILGDRLCVRECHAVVLDQHRQLTCGIERHQVGARLPRTLKHALEGEFLLSQNQTNLAAERR